MKIQETQAKAFEDRTFTIELSGHELAHIYQLSFREEGANFWPDTHSGLRVHALIGEAVDPGVLAEIQKPRVFR